MEAMSSYIMAAVHSTLHIIAQLTTCKSVCGRGLSQCMLCQLGPQFLDSGGLGLQAVFWCRIQHDHSMVRLEHLPTSVQCCGF